MINVTHAMLYDKHGLLHIAILYQSHISLRIFLKYFEKGHTKKRLIFEIFDYKKVIVIKEKAYILQNDKIFKLHKEKHELFYQNKKLEDITADGKKALKAIMKDGDSLCFNC